ncbi:hypothetical protein B0H11DRAFT_2172848 [Mycena galericulata]|nr:hypothetical protein B0H11DRAFT_2172848 [Mycena galericulata]
MAGGGVLVVFLAAVSVHAASSAFPAGVLATGTMGSTNPPTPTIEVAWCTLPRNNARVIPDGTFTGVSFLKTPFYVQVLGYGDFTKINLAPNDFGGLLDPHGVNGLGIPVGGNVSSTAVDGTNEAFSEWLLYISCNSFCLRVCTNANSQFKATDFCRPDLDLLGCTFSFPANYNFNGTFQTCDADAGYPPGWYPVVNDGTTTFSIYTQPANGEITSVQPPATTPASSNCVPTSTISNGIALASLTAGAFGTAPPTGFGSTSPSRSGTPTGSSTQTSRTSGSAGTNSNSSGPTGGTNPQKHVHSLTSCSRVD